MLECLVFGHRAAESVNRSTAKPDESSLKFVGNIIGGKKYTIDRKATNILRDELRSVNTKYIGPVRTTEGMKYALDYFEKRMQELDDTYTDTLYAMELYNMTEFSYLAAKGAYERKESVGAHYIEDTQ